MDSLIKPCEIDLDKYLEIINKNIISQEELRLISAYPYVSMSHYCTDLKPSEYNDVIDVEIFNIWFFFYNLSLIFGIGSQDSVTRMNNLFRQEPFKSAILVARQEKNESDRVSRFMIDCCKMILSLGKKGTTFDSPINIRIYGDLPFRFTDTLRNQADAWYRNFVNLKLDAMKVVYRSFGPDVAYSFIFKSVAHSLYEFHPSRYSLYHYHCKDESEAIHQIMHNFVKYIENNRTYIKFKQSK